MNADKPGFKYKEQEATAKFAYFVIPAKAGIQNSLNRAPKSGIGFRVALRLPGMTTSPCFREF
jgi:hypothetical protein